MLNVKNFFKKKEKNYEESKGRVQNWIYLQEINLKFS